MALLEEIARKLSNLLNGRRMTVNEQVKYNQLLEILNELPKEIDVKVKYSGARERYTRKGPDAARFVLAEFLEPNRIVYVEAKHQVFADYIERKHYFDLKLGIEFEKKESFEDKSLPVKEATISYLKRD